MECLAPGIINDDDLLRYALDPEDLALEARQHFDQCPACRARADEYRSLSTALAARLHRWDCPPTLLISEYAAGLLTGKKRKKLMQHLKHCTRCSQEAAISQEFLGTTKTRLPQERHTPLSLFPQPLQLATARRQRGGHPWPRKEEIDGLRLSLELVTLAPPGVALTGLLVQLDDSRSTLEGTQIALFAASDSEQPPLSVTSVDQFGNFMFAHLSPGSYRLSIALPEGTHLIEGIEIDT